MKIAFMFPGQGAQYAGMGKDLAEKYRVARDLFETADAVLGFPLSKLCFEGPEHDLKLTENTQPAILTVSVAVAKVLESEGVMPDFVAGHSLGEYSAVVTAGGMSFEDAVSVVRKRGQYMQEAVPEGHGTMAAILGMELATVEELCRDASNSTSHPVSPANINSPEQVVIAGATVAVEAAVQLAKGRGAKRAVVLQVSAPFHCAMLRPAQERLEGDLDAIHFSELRVPLVNNLTASEVTAAEKVRAGLVGQVAAPVLWDRAMRRTAELGAAMFVECGPGRVLSGLLRQIDRSLTSANVEDEKSLLAALPRLKAAVTQ